MARDINIIEILNSSPSITLLRARSSQTILEFFTSVFDETTVISQENLYNQLTEFLDRSWVIAAVIPKYLSQRLVRNGRKVTYLRVVVTFAKTLK